MWNVRAKILTKETSKTTFDTDLPLGKTGKGKIIS